MDQKWKHWLLNDRQLVRSVCGLHVTGLVLDESTVFRVCALQALFSMKIPIRIMASKTLSIALKTTNFY